MRSATSKLFPKRIKEVLSWPFDCVLSTIKSQKGLTLFELLIVITIISLVGTSSFYVSSNFLVENYLDNKTNEVVTMLRNAQINSMSGKEDSNWGVHISSSDIILYKGPTYLSRDQSFDETTSIPASITINATDINFNNPTGIPDNFDNIVISNNKGNSNTVSVNAYGTVDLN